MNKKIPSLRVNNKFKPWLNKRYNYNTFLESTFLEFIQISLNLETNYSILIKLSIENKKFYMIGSQIGLVIKDSHDLNNYKNIYQLIIDLIESTSDSYGIGTPSSLIIMYKELSSFPVLEIKNIKNLSLGSEPAPPPLWVRRGGERKI